MHGRLRVRQWLQERMERTENRATGRKEQLKILKRLTDAVFSRTHPKPFRVQTSRSKGPRQSHLSASRGRRAKVDEIVLAMAHRGRLNVLANIMGKSTQQIFREFADIDPELHSRGDVKYHLGYSNDCTTTSGHKVHLSLCFNQSHLGSSIRWPSAA
jgi:2-oxoglutarate dehydrogenase E1 component